MAFLLVLAPGLYNSANEISVWLTEPATNSSNSKLYDLPNRKLHKLHQNWILCHQTGVSLFGWLYTISVPPCSLAPEPNTVCFS